MDEQAISQAALNQMSRADLNALGSAYVPEANGQPTSTLTNSATSVADNIFATVAAADSVRDAARKVLLADQRKMEEYIKAEEMRGNIEKPSRLKKAWHAFTSWIGGKKEEEPIIDLSSRREGSPHYGGGYAGDGGGGGSAFGSGSFGHPVNAAVSGTSQSAVWQPTEYSVWRMMEAMDGKPLEGAVFGGQKSGKTQATGALLSSLQAIMGFENLLYGLGANSSYDSPDNVTLRQFVHNDQVTVISCPADIGNLVDRAVSTNEKKVSLVFLGSAVSLEVVLGYY
eukprot:gene22195-33335_t